MTPLVSVIIPTYNRAAMLERAMNSVVSQDYTNLEMIVVDDASRDDTKDVVKGIQDSRLRYLCRDQNGGAGAARNTGFGVSQGELITFLDSDDEYCPGKLGKQVQLFEKLSPQPDFIFSNYWEVGRNKTLTVSSNVPSGYVDTSRFFPASVFCASPGSWMLRRRCVQGEFFDEKLRTSEDLDFFARLVRKHITYFLNEPQLIKHVHSDAQGNVPIHFSEQTGERLLHKWLPEMQQDRSFLVKFYCELSKDLKRCQKRGKALQFLWKALSLRPLSGRLYWKLAKIFW